MRILFVADGRSPTALSWLAYWIARGHEVHLVSTFPCETLPGLRSLVLLPVAFNRLAGQGGQGRMGRPGIISRLRDPLRKLRYLLGPMSLPPARRQFRRLVGSIQPDLIHALRIPFEGMLAATAPASVPLLLSIWGNDLTLHAPGSFLMERLTRQALRRANGLIADTGRDIRLGREFGFAGPALVVPGGGGIHLEALHTDEPALPEDLPAGPIVVNPRGQRPGSLRQDVFFRAIPQVLAQVPGAVFICPPLRGDVQAERWVDALDIRTHVRLWPRLSQPQLWRLYRQAQVFVSPSVHDGTPNSLLEAMACGCFPVAGDIESMREWITSGVNGLLVDASDENALAQAMITALLDPALRAGAARENARLIAGRAAYQRAMAEAEAFYQGILESRRT